MPGTRPRRERFATQVGTALLLLTTLACGRDRPQRGAGEPGGSEPEQTQVEPLDARLTASLPAGVTAADAQRGRELFMPCAVCHGLDARGTQLGPSLRDDEWIHGSRDMAQLERVIREGVAEPEEYPVPMPVLGGGSFSAQDIRALAAYVYAVSGDTSTPAR